MKKKIAVLGATGRTGTWIVKDALKRGYSVNALVREGSSLAIEDNELTIVKGTPSSRKDLQAALSGCEAVLIALSISRKIEWWPWSELSASPTFMSDVASNIIALARETGLKRCSILTAWGTSETRQHIPSFFRFMIDYTNIGAVYQDHNRQEKVWEESGLDWTIVRPVGLTNDTEEKPIQVLLDTSETRPAKLQISRRMVARFMLDSVEEGTYIHQKPIISYRS